MPLPALPFRALPKLADDWIEWFRALKAVVDRIHVVSGTPEGSVKAPIGHIALRTDGGTSTTLYVKEADGGDATGWVAK